MIPEEVYKRAKELMAASVKGAAIFTDEQLMLGLAKCLLTQQYNEAVMIAQVLVARYEAQVEALKDSPTAFTS